MSQILKTLGAFAVVLMLVACNANGSIGVPGVAGASNASTSASRHLQIWGPNVVAACPPSRGKAECLALIRTGPQLVRDGGSGPNGGFTPSQLQAAYDLPSASKGSGQTVAIVDAYDNPNVASDLAFYRNYFGLPTSNFTKYNQEGQIGEYPPASMEWGLEIDLDIEMVSASCPNCSIILVEANSSAISDIETAEAEAVTLGAKIVSNSYACYPGQCAFDESYYDTPGVTYLAAAGDDGYGTGVATPSAFDTVVSVGGTSLYADPKSGRGYSETAWLGTDSGCSTETKPSWQHDPGCSYRTANDVAAIADPATGPAEYDSFGYGGWFVSGGTSTATPLLAGIFALAGNASSQNGGKTFWNKQNRKKYLFAVTEGYNGSCSPTYLCTDGTKEYGDYGGPTGWGTPNGIGAF